MGVMLLAALFRCISAQCSHHHSDKVADAIVDRPFHEFAEMFFLSGCYSAIFPGVSRVISRVISRTRTCTMRSKPIGGNAGGMGRVSASRRRVEGRMTRYLPPLTGADQDMERIDDVSSHAMQPIYDKMSGFIGHWVL
jgi:hypothetical protein